MQGRLRGRPERHGLAQGRIAMCKPLPPKKWKNCRCGHPAVIGDKCGHCYVRLVLDPFQKRSRRSKLVIGGGGK